ncbi:MAG: hypothetical protein ACYDHM_14075 [Acidiferrobacterales bacterium]
MQSNPRFVARGMVLGLALVMAQSAQALSLTRGTPTTLTGTLGNVEVNYVSDNPTLTGYLGPSGIVTGVNIPETRVQYDLLNMAGNGSILNYTVDYSPGTNVLGAMEATGYYDSAGVEHSWNGAAYTTLFDKGYGTYNYNQALFGSLWTIDYQPDHVTWSTSGNNFPADAASGETNFGFNPTFSLDFAQGTLLGLQPANVTGLLVTGGPSSSTGMVLSAVPIPGAAWLFGSGLIGLICLARRKAA